MFAFDGHLDWLEEHGFTSVAGLTAGSEGLDRILTPEKFSRRSSVNSVTFSPLTNASPNRNLESTVASLEAAVSDSQAKCAALITDLSNPGSCVHLEEIKLLNQKLENMQILLSRLRTQI